MPRVAVVEKQAEELERLVARAEELVNEASEEDKDDWISSPITKALFYLLESNILSLTLAWREGALYQATLPTYTDSGAVFKPADPDAEKRGLHQVQAFESVLEYMEQIQEWIDELKEEEEEDADTNSSSRSSETMSY